jgi:hypothetical protein
LFLKEDYPKKYMVNVSHGIKKNTLKSVLLIFP